MPTGPITDTGNQGSIPEREHGKRLSRLRPAAGAQIVLSPPSGETATKRIARGIRVTGEMD